MFKMVAVVALACQLAAQTLEELRQSVRDAARASRYSAFAPALADLGDDNEIAIGNLRIDGEPRLHVHALSLPLSRELDLGWKSTKLRLEGTLGYTSARFDTADFWSGALPGLETQVTSRYETYGFDAGLGPSIDFGNHIRLQPLAHFGVSYIENNALYGGPGSGITRALFDGILFNWDGVYGSYGGSLALRGGDYSLGGTVLARSVLRYDLRHADGWHVDDPAVDSDDTLQWMTARSDFDGATGATLGEAPLHWLGNVSYKRFVGGNDDLLGFRELVTLGAGLKLQRVQLPVVSTLVFGANMHFGPNIQGWDFALSAKF